MNYVLLALGGGVSSGAIMLLLSHVAPRFGAGNLIRETDQPTIFGKPVTRREAHFVGVFAHLTLSALFGAAYGMLVAGGLVSGFQLLPMLGWGVILTLVTGGIVLPLEGHGLFGMKEDAWFPIDLLLTNCFWALLFWWLMRIWTGLAVIS